MKRIGRCRRKIFNPGSVKSLPPYPIHKEIKMKKLVATLVLFTFVLTGCFGSFNLTRKVYQFNKSQGDKWVQEIVFIVLVVVPVYGLSALADGVVFNSVEFWTGRNPVAANGIKPVMIAKGQNGEATLLFDAPQEKISLQIAQGQTSKELAFVPGENGVVAEDAQGQVQFTAITNADGSVSVYDRDQHLLQNFTAGQVAALTEKKS